MSNIIRTEGLPPVRTKSANLASKKSQSHASLGTATRVGSGVRAAGSTVKATDSGGIFGSSEDLPSRAKSLVRDGGGDDRNGDFPTQTAKKKTTSKKMLFLWSFMAYGVICLVFLGIIFIVLIVVWFRKMKYFIREPNTAQLLDVIPNVLWIFVFFMIGSLEHLILNIFCILILSGHRSTEKLVTRYREKLMMWVFILACIGEFIMLKGTFDHIGSDSTVVNGMAAQTLIPMNSNPKHLACFDTTIMPTTQQNNSYLQVNLVRANLKWMVHVSCGDSAVGDSSVPTWRLVLDNLMRSKVENKNCVAVKKELIENAKSDCNLITGLDGVIYAWLVIDGLGLWFCGGILYLYLKSMVRHKPARFSFATSTYHDDIDLLRQVAEKVHILAEQRNNEIKNSHQKSTEGNVSKHSRGSRKSSSGANMWIEIERKALKEIAMKKDAINRSPSPAK